MKKIASALLGMWLLVLVATSAQTYVVKKTDCSSLNKDLPQSPHQGGNAVGHYSGGHGWDDNTLGKCYYSGTAQVGAQVPCHPQSQAQSISTYWENGEISNTAHIPTANDRSGTTDGADGGTAVSDTEGAAAVESCDGNGCTGSTITIGGSGAGVGFSVSYSSPLNETMVYSDQFYYKNNCTGYILAALPPPAPACITPNPPTPPTYETCANQDWSWNVNTCSWQCLTGASPIAIDTKGNRWTQQELFTDPTAGNYVSFDLQGNGVILKLSWPKYGSGVAWLAYDRDGDGVIKNGQELFGNFTPHSDGDYIAAHGGAKSSQPNGFLALDWYDQLEQGGNGDSIISKKDAIWSKLRLWFPGQHCYTNKDTACHSLPEELHHPEEFGITSISGVYGGGMGDDEVGNEYRFSAVVNPLAETVSAHGENHQTSNDKDKSGRQLNRIAYDVWLKIVR